MKFVLKAPNRVIIMVLLCNLLFLLHAAPAVRCINCFTIFKCIPSLLNEFVGFCLCIREIVFIDFGCSLFNNWIKYGEIYGNSYGVVIFDLFSFCCFSVKNNRRV